MEEEFKRITIKIPIKLWKQVRRHQEGGRIKSFQEAAINGMALLLVQKLGEEKDEGMPHSD